MKILQISDLAPPHIGGVEKVVWKYASLLSKEGNDVSILTSSLPNVKNKERIENVTFNRVPKIALALPSLYTNDFEIIHTHSYISFFDLSIEKKIRGSVIIKHVHSVYGSDLENFTGWSVSRIFSKIERYLLSADCTAYIVPSEFTKKNLRNFGINKEIHVVPHGTDYEKFPEKEKAREFLNLPKEKKIIGFIGRMSSGKGPQDLAKIWGEIKKKLPDSILIFIGPDPNVKTSGIVGISEQVKKIIAESGYKEDVIFTGMVEEEKMPYYIASLDLFASPSINEGFGLTILNSMAAGVPVVAYNNSAIPEVVGDAGLLVPTKDLESLKNAIINILSDEKLYREMSTMAMLRASQFTWNKAVNSLYNIYSNYL